MECNNGLKSSCYTDVETEFCSIYTMEFLNDVKVKLHNCIKQVSKLINNEIIKVEMFF
ncbi:hypothetical protein JYU34_021284 [Plutella xylostella]|uniref:Uncharacterized protein n=1 Tax=Plutella xylostella TaxID=51655 RepID=A0ABQ7PX00_PLUXY|nr:hypothetical protein JYU34_021284 [Plutella xylostella]